MPARDEKISVCLPVFNGSKYLAPAIDSVLGQSYANFELLIADDLSTDDSYEIIEKYGRGDSRIIHWKNSRNFGIFANYNECMKRASGSFIKLFAQDDVFEPSCLAELLTELLKHENVSLITAARAVIDQEGQQTGVERFFDKTTIIAGRDVIADYAKTFVYRTGTPCQVMFKKVSMGTGFDTRYTLSGDIEYFLRILESGDFIYLDHVLVKFRRHAESVTVTSLKDMSFVADAFRLAEKYANLLDEPGKKRTLVNNALMEGLMRKVNNAIHDRKIDFSNLLAASTPNGDDVNYERIAYHLLFYAAQLKMELSEIPRLLKEKQDPESKQQLNYSQQSYLELENRANNLARELEELRSSSSWKITQPLRWFRKALL
jgi:glycosyltransferase involved in cell wall biosynthesis